MRYPQACSFASNRAGLFIVRATSGPLLSLWATLFPRCRESKACGFCLACADDGRRLCHAKGYS